MIFDKIFQRIMEFESKDFEIWKLGIWKLVSKPNGGLKVKFESSFCK